MTITHAHRRIALAILAVVALAVVYLIGAAQSGGTVAAAAPTRTVDTPATPSSTIPGAGGAGITVTGSADAAGTPDTLLLDLSVVATDPSVTDALAKANVSADAVQKVLLANGVAKKDLQTSGLSISPNYDYTKNGAPRLKGYEVSESVNATLRDLAQAGNAIGKAVGAGGNAVRVNQVSLDLEGTSALVTQARDKAFADAKTKAEQYAKAAGRSLGTVVSIAENLGSPSPDPMSAGAAGEMFKRADVPVEPGSQKVAVTVTVVFAMA